MLRSVSDAWSIVSSHLHGLVSAVAQVVHEALDKPRNIHFKGVTDLVTDTDRASEEAILEASHAIRMSCRQDKSFADA